MVILENRVPDMTDTKPTGHEFDSPDTRTGHHAKVLHWAKFLRGKMVKIKNRP